MLWVSVAGEALCLYAERGLFWKRTRTLIIADPHFGKPAAFHAAGIPVPSLAHDEDLARLSRLLKETQASRLVVLGDFFHAVTGRDEYTLSRLEAWRKAHSCVEIQLVRGNHDRRAGDPPSSLQIECVDPPFSAAPFELCHDPAEAPPKSGYALAGHLHPGLGLSDVTGASFRFPCFHFTPTVGVLPAFGCFTGTHPVRPGKADGIYLIAEERLIQVRALAA